MAGGVGDIYTWLPVGDNFFEAETWIKVGKQAFAAEVGHNTRED
jgi:hypothetical protein